GFQHRRLARNFDLVTIDPTEWEAGEKLLPAGRWREPKSSIQRAHAACVHENSQAPFPKLPIPAFRLTTRVDGIYKDAQQVALDQVRARPVIAFAGIATPERF